MKIKTWKHFEPERVKLVDNNNKNSEMTYFIKKIVKNIPEFNKFNQVFLKKWTQNINNSN